MDKLIASKFMEKMTASAQCAPHGMAVSMATLKAGSITNCADVTINIGNNSTIQPVLCNSVEVAKLLGDITATVVSDDDAMKTAVNNVLQKSLGAGAFTDVSDNIKSVINMRCTPSIIANQGASVTLALEDCSDVNIQITNTLDAATVCALGKTQQVMQAAGYGAPPAPPPAPSPILSKTTVVVIVILAAIGLLFAVASGLYYRSRR